jgi:hypothetical protein
LGPDGVLELEARGLLAGDPELFGEVLGFGCAEAPRGLLLAALDEPPARGPVPDPRAPALGAVEEPDVEPDWPELGLGFPDGLGLLVDGADEEAESEESVDRSFVDDGEAELDGEAGCTVARFAWPARGWPASALVDGELAIAGAARAATDRPSAAPVSVTVVSTREAADGACRRPTAMCCPRGARRSLDAMRAPY